MLGSALSRLPFSARVCCTLFLLGIGLGQVAAVTQATTAVGLSYQDVVASLRPEMPMMPMAGGQLAVEKGMDLSQISHTAKVWIRTPLLIQTSHTHLFGMTLIAALLGLILLFSTCYGERTKVLILSLPFVGTILDIGGMWLTRFVCESCATLVMIGGSLFGLGYLLIAGVALYEMWIKHEVQA